jgi:TatD DNase family protein
MIYDIHCHLDLYEDEEEVKEVVKNAIKNEVKCMITNSVDISSCEKNLEYAKKYKDIVRLAVGFYPKDALDRESEDIDIKIKRKSETFSDLKKFVIKNKKDIIALGETGLDLYNGKDIEEQKKLLKQELKLAEDLDIPIILHSRKAEAEIVEFAKDFKCKRVLHCFSGKFSLIKKAVEYGYYFSIPTNIVRLEHFKNMVKEVPKNRILTETDAPFLSPYKEKKNEPAFVHETIKEIKKIWNLTGRETEEILWKNFKEVFNYKD